MELVLIVLGVLAFCVIGFVLTRLAAAAVRRIVAYFVLPDRPPSLTRLTTLVAGWREERQAAEAAERLDDQPPPEIVLAFRAFTASQAAALTGRVRRHPPASTSGSYRAVQPLSKATGVPVNARPPGPRRNAATSATSAGSSSSLDRLRLEEDVAQCVVLRETALGGERGDLALDERCSDVAGAERHGSDIVGRTLQCEGLDEPDDAVLCGDVARLERRGDETVHGCDDDDPAFPAGPQVWPGIAREQERARQENRDERVPAVLVELLDGGDVLEPRIRDDRVDPAEALDRRVDGSPVALPRRQIRGEPVTGPRRIWVEVDGEHMPAVRHEPLARSRDRSRSPRR